MGHFSDDKRLTPQEIKTIVSWVEQGAPRGDGPDPLGAVKHVAQEWPLGKPDLIIDVPAYKIPASGVVDYQRPAVPGTLTEGKWVRASTVKPGSRQGVHHLLTGWMEEMPKDDPHWLDRVRQLKALIAEHAHLEEEVEFPKLRALISFLRRFG